jgi:hypothetical protein
VITCCIKYEEVISIILLSGNVPAPTEDKSDHTKDSFSEELEHVFDQFLKYHVKIMLGDFNAKVGREGIFKPRIGNKILCGIGNDNGVRIVNFAPSESLSSVQVPMLQHS